jgi:hypothetical protein
MTMLLTMDRQPSCSIFCGCAEDKFLFLAKRQAQHEIAFVHQALRTHEVEHVEIVIEVHGMRFGGTSRDVEDKNAAGIEQ